MEFKVIQGQLIDLGVNGKPMYDFLLVTNTLCLKKRTNFETV